MKGRTGFFQHDLYQLHQGRNNQNKGYSLQILQISRQQNAVIDDIGCQGGQRHDKQYRKAHTHSSSQFIADSQKGADTKKLYEYDIIDKNGTNHNRKIIHASPPAELDV